MSENEFLIFPPPSPTLEQLESSFKIKQNVKLIEEKLNNIKAAFTEAFTEEEVLWKLSNAKEYEEIRKIIKWLYRNTIYEKENSEIFKFIKSYQAYYDIQKTIKKIIYFYETNLNEGSAWYFFDRSLEKAFKEVEEKIKAKKFIDE